MRERKLSAFGMTYHTVYIKRLTLHDIPAKSVIFDEISLDNVCIGMKARRTAYCASVIRSTDQSKATQI